METADLVLIGIVSCIISAFSCVVFAFVLHQLRNRDVNGLYSRVESLEMAIRGEKGRNNRAEKAERMQTAMVEVAAIMKNPEITDKQGAIMQLALKYPDIALDLIKKGL